MHLMDFRMRSVRWASTALRCLLRTALTCASMSVATASQVPLLRIGLVEYQGVMLCQECEDPLREGSLIPALSNMYSPKGFMVTGDLVYAVPNKGEAPLLNDHEVHGRIALFDRGKVSFVRKVQHAQQAGAIGVIIINDDRCDHGGEACFDDQLEIVRQRIARAEVLPTSATVMLERDGFSAWREIRIPSVLISSSDGDRLRGFMQLSKFDLHGEPNYFTEGAS